MDEVFSLGGPVLKRDGQLLLLIPLEEERNSSSARGEFRKLRAVF